MNIPCICPPKDGAPRHPDGDEITLRPALAFRQALAVRNSVGLLYATEPDAEMADVLAVLTEGYLLNGIESWTLDDGKPIPVNNRTIREHLLSHVDIAMTIGDAADELYSEAVMSPLLAKASTLSPPTPTDESTSRTTGSSTTPRKQSKRSSITTIPTADTEMTSQSLDGVSSSSLSSTSAA